VKEAHSDIADFYLFNPSMYSNPPPFVPNPQLFSTSKYNFVLMYTRFIWDGKSNYAAG